MEANNLKSLEYPIQQVREGKRHFENACRAVARMVLNEPSSIDKVMVNGKSTYDFKIFRTFRRKIVM